MHKLFGRVIEKPRLDNLYEDRGGCAFARRGKLFAGLFQGMVF